MDFHAALRQIIALWWSSVIQYRWIVIILVLSLNSVVVYEQLQRLTEYLASIELFPPAFSTLQALNWNPKQFAAYHIGAHQDFEKTLAFLRGDSVFKRMCERFQLPARYEAIEPERANFLKKVYQDRVQINNIRRASLLIRVYETDPTLAQRMADTLRVIAEQYYDLLANRRLMFKELQASETFLVERQQQVNDSAGLIRFQHRVYLLNRLNEATSYALGPERIFQPEFIKYYDRLLALEYQSRRLGKKIAETRQRLSHLHTHLHTYTTLCSNTGKAIVRIDDKRPERWKTIFLYLGLSILLITGWLGLYAVVSQMLNEKTCSARGTTG